MAVRTLHDDWKFYYSPNCQMYEHVRAGTVFDGDIGVYLAKNASDSVEVIDPPAPPPVAALAPAPVAPPVAATAPKSAGADPVTEKPAGTGQGDSKGPFDPAEHSGPQVIAYAKDHPDQVAAIRAAEDDPETGKRRTTVLAALSAH